MLGVTGCNYTCLVNNEGFWEGLVTVCLPLSLTHGEGSRNWLWALGTQMVS